MGDLLLVQLHQAAQHLEHHALATLRRERQPAEAVTARRGLLHHDEGLPVDAVAQDGVQALMDLRQLPVQHGRPLEVFDHPPPRRLRGRDLLCRVIRVSRRSHAGGPLGVLLSSGHLGVEIHLEPHGGRVLRPALHLRHHGLRVGGAQAPDARGAGGVLLVPRGPPRREAGGGEQRLDGRLRRARACREAVRRRGPRRRRDLGAPPWAGAAAERGGLALGRAPAILRVGRDELAQRRLLVHALDAALAALLVVAPDVHALVDRIDQRGLALRGVAWEPPPAHERALATLLVGVAVAAGRGVGVLEAEKLGQDLAHPEAVRAALRIDGSLLDAGRQRQAEGGAEVGEQLARPLLHVRLRGQEVLQEAVLRQHQRVGEDVRAAQRGIEPAEVGLTPSETPGELPASSATALGGVPLLDEDAEVEECDLAIQCPLLMLNRRLLH
mmetsp:Transcript_49590/g.146530  ORF Transcript_49590/g.146530 Transcript_49590/m.146530 type:complete len:441 (-) Transcript_49590:373-1695(-)